MPDKKKLELKLRKATLEQLGVLQLLTHSPNATISTEEVRDSTSTVDQSLGGTISSIARFRDTNGDPIVLPVGRDRDKGQLWKLNEKVVGKDELAVLLDEILGEPERYK